MTAEDFANIPLEQQVEIYRRYLCEAVAIIEGRVVIRPRIFLGVLGIPEAEIPALEDFLCHGLPGRSRVLATAPLDKARTEPVIPATELVQ